MTGRYFVLEGIDGAGTTTQRDKLVGRLNQEGFPGIKTAEPTSRLIGKLIRGYLDPEALKLDPIAMALLFAADRVDHIRNVVEPALRSGLFVVADRYVVSSLAYQTTAGVPRSFVHAANFSHGLLRVPDLLLYVRVSPDVAAQRRAARGGKVEIFDDDLVQRQVAAAYEAEVQTLRELGWPCVVVDGDGTPDNVAAQIWSSVFPILT